MRVSLRVGPDVDGVQPMRRPLHPVRGAHRHKLRPLRVPDGGTPGHLVREGDVGPPVGPFPRRRSHNVGLDLVGPGHSGQGRFRHAVQPGAVRTS